MNHLTVSGILAAVCLVCATTQVQAAGASSSRLQLQRDPVYEQNLRYLASADTAITPAKVLRWVNSLMGHASRRAPSNIDFEPIFRAHDNQQQIIAQLDYKF